MSEVPAQPYQGQCLTEICSRLTGEKLLEDCMSGANDQFTLLFSGELIELSGTTETFS